MTRKRKAKEIVIHNDVLLSEVCLRAVLQYAVGQGIVSEQQHYPFFNKRLHAGKLESSLDSTGKRVCR